jgi:hypothetical protein
MEDNSPQAIPNSSKTLVTTLDPPYKMRKPKLLKIRQQNML